MKESVDFDYWDQLPSFCGPRISPRLRIRRIVERQNAIEERARMQKLKAWGEAYRKILRAEVHDLFVAEMRKVGFCQNSKRSDEDETT